MNVLLRNDFGDQVVIVLAVHMEYEWELYRCILTVEAKLVLHFPHYVFTDLLISLPVWIREGGREKEIEFRF